jgi:UTP--glucose-1-phosphate uridylyltransferase
MKIFIIISLSLHMTIPGRLIMARMHDYSTFGQCLQQAREAADLSRQALAQRVGLDPSYIYRVETGARRPSREAALAFAEALGVQGEAVNAWLEAAGYAPLPLLPRVRGAIRTRGAVRTRGRSPGPAAEPSPVWDTARWAQWLEAMGLKDASLAHLLQALETAEPQQRQAVTQAVAATFTRLIEQVEAPVRTAIIPAAGGQHRLFAPHVMQRLLLRAMREAVESGLSRIVLVLPPGLEESLYMPLKAACELALVPLLTVRYCVQPSPDGLGDAVLQAQAEVGAEPFAVLLPDDIVRERMGRAVYTWELRRMLEAFRHLARSHLVSVTRVPKTKMSQCGVVRVAAREVLPSVQSTLQLIEKPPATHPICRATRTFGIVGRYLLQPSIFEALLALRDQGPSPVHLTAALDHLRQAGEDVYTFALEGKREDLGAVFVEARTRLGGATDTLPTF